MYNDLMCDDPNINKNKINQINERTVVYHSKGSKWLKNGTFHLFLEIYYYYAELIKVWQK